MQCHAFLLSGVARIGQEAAQRVVRALQHLARRLGLPPERIRAWQGAELGAGEAA